MPLLLLLLLPPPLLLLFQSRKSSSTVAAAAGGLLITGWLAFVPLPSTEWYRPGGGRPSSRYRSSVRPAALSARSRTLDGPARRPAGQSA